MNGSFQDFEYPGLIETQTPMNNINQELRKAFDASFEELSITDPRPPDFSMWGKSYLGKWKQLTMTMFLNDLNDLVRGNEEAAELKAADLNKEVERLEEELKEARARSVL